jgi:hypothetical protein
LLACIFLLLLVFAIILTKLKVSIHYSHYQDNDSLKIEFKAWFGLIKYKLNIPLIKVDDNSPTIVIKEEVQSGRTEEPKKKDTKQFSVEDILNSIRDMKAILEHVVSLHRIIRHFFKKVSVTKLEWHTAMGVGDAALTGMLTGALWTIKGSVIGMVSHYFRLLENPSMTVQPLFQMAISQTSFKCMLHFRIGYAMVAGIKLLKFWKGGRPHFKSKMLSGLSQDKTKPV